MLVTPVSRAESEAESERSGVVNQRSVGWLEEDEEQRHALRIQGLRKQALSSERERSDPLIDGPRRSCGSPTI